MNVQPNLQMDKPEFLAWVQAGKAVPCRKAGAAPLPTLQSCGARQK